ncbi:MAG: tetratricopeptide repeat protein [bacterium]|nr:tetratricopeptide repeat protein [bacterium]
MAEDKSIERLKRILDYELAMTGDARNIVSFYGEIRKLANEAGLPDFTALVYVYEQMRECEYDAAIRRIKKVLPGAENAAFYLNIACAVAFIFKYEQDKSGEFIAAAAEIDPDNYRVAYTRAQVDYINEEYDSSLRNFTEAMKVEPTLPSPYIGIANVHLAKEDYNKALGYFERALEISNEIPHTFCGLARMMMSRRNYATAERYIQSALDLDAENPYVSSVSASFYYETGRLDIALEITGSAVERCPEDRYARLNLGGYLYSAGRYEEALEHAEIALRLGAEGAQDLINNIKKTIEENVKPRFIDAGERLPHKE